MCIFAETHVDGLTLINMGWIYSLLSVSLYTVSFCYQKHPKAVELCTKNGSWELLGGVLCLGCVLAVSPSTLPWMVYTMFIHFWRKPPKKPSQKCPEINPSQTGLTSKDARWMVCYWDGLSLGWHYYPLVIKHGESTYRYTYKTLHYITLHHITSHTYDFRLPFSLGIFQSSTIPSFHHSPQPRDSPTTSVTSIIVDLDLNLLWNYPLVN